MNTRSTGLQRRLATAIAVAGTLATVTSTAWAEEPWNAHVHRMGVAEEHTHEAERMHENPFVPEHNFDMHRDAPSIHNEGAHFVTPRGTIVSTLPRETVVVQHAGVSYNFYNGVWYRPYGASFVVVAAPIGAFIP